MEIILRSEIFYKSPEFHSKLRKTLTACTDCIVNTCEPSSLDPCVEICMKPCVAFKLSYDSKKNELLEDLKKAMISECLNAKDQDSCSKSVVSHYNESISSLLTTFTNS